MNKLKIVQPVFLMLAGYFMGMMDYVINAAESGVGWLSIPLLGYGASIHFWWDLFMLGAFASFSSYVIIARLEK